MKLKNSNYMIICDSYKDAIEMLLKLERDQTYSFGRFSCDYEVDNYPAYYYTHDIDDSKLLKKEFRFHLTKGGDITSKFVISGKDITRIQISTCFNKGPIVLFDKKYSKESSINLHFPIITIATCKTDVRIDVEAESLSEFKSLNYILSNTDRRFLATTPIKNKRLMYSYGILEPYQASWMTTFTEYLCRLLI